MAVSGCCDNDDMSNRGTRRPASEVLPTASLRLPRLPDGITGVEVRRSTRRRSTVSARVESGRIVLQMPATLRIAEEQHWVDSMVERVGAKRARPGRSDAELLRRAETVAARYLEPVVGQRLAPGSVRWVTNMNRRWASCSTDSGAIRVSHRLQQMPEYVLDYVLVHELIHLVEPGHNKRFHALLAAYPLAERAEGFLQGWSAANQLPTGDPEELLG